MSGEFAHSLDSARDLREVAELLAAETERLGFEYFTYESLSSNPLFITTYPWEWLLHYGEQQHTRNDLVYQYPLKSDDASTWQEIASRQVLSKPQRLVLTRQLPSTSIVEEWSRWEANPTRRI